MDRNDIILRAHALKTKEDFLALLNRIKLDEMRVCGMADRFHPFTIRHINYYCNPNHIFHRYHHFKIKKKTGGFRQITAPRNRSFMMMLQATNEILKAVYTPSDYAMGFAVGRSVVSNAAIHCGQNYVMNIDLKDFFPSIKRARVCKRLQLPPFNFPIEIALCVAGLCTMRVPKEGDETDDSNQFDYVLPQGAPTSPIITNMICDTLDRRLVGLAKRFGLRYSRYADDISFSSMHNVYQKGGDFWKELNRIIGEQGFTINQKKTRLQKRGGRQEVTGLIVSEKVNVTKKYVRDIRNLLYIWERHGLCIAESRFVPKYKREKGYVKKGNPNIINVLDGKLLYLKMVRGENDMLYIRLRSRFEKLVEAATNSSRVNSIGITYMETMPLLEFEQKNATEINIKETKHGRKATFNIAGIHHEASIQSFIYINIGEEDNKNNLAISKCSSESNKQFWLIHNKDKETVHTPPAIDVDELNKDLDSLLNM